jgi:hypothetical protein
LPRYWRRRTRRGKEVPGRDSVRWDIVPRNVARLIDRPRVERVLGTDTARQSGRPFEFVVTSTRPPEQPPPPCSNRDGRLPDRPWTEVPALSRYSSSAGSSARRGRGQFDATRASQEVSPEPTPGANRRQETSLWTRSHLRRPGVLSSKRSDSALTRGERTSQSLRCLQT